MKRGRREREKARKSAKDNPDGARWLHGNQRGDDSKIVKGKGGGREKRETAEGGGKVSKAGPDFYSTARS